MDRRKRKAIRHAGVLLLLMAGAADGQSLLGAADRQYWYDQARRIVDSAALKAGGTSGKFRNTTPYDVHVPGGNMGYPAFWVRDGVMMLGADFISAAELEGWIRLMASTLLGPQDWQVRPGVVVPAYAVPDHINFSGLPTFYPGNYETGEKQGGPPFGKYPPLDDHFYFLTAVYEHWKLARSTRLFDSPIKTSFSEIKLADLCERVYRVAPEDEASRLCVAGNIETENAKDFGFCDAVSKSGTLLFPSLLKAVAARQLAELFEAVGQPLKARRYSEDVERIRAAIPRTFLKSGWLHSATGVGNQPDVWGSAFAVWSGSLDDPTAREVSRSLVKAFRDRSAVQQGCVRHIPAGGWQVSLSKIGEYQNGGYWGTPSGWYIAAMAKTDRDAAAAMARDFVRFLRDHRRADGNSEAWEWFNPATGRQNNPLYVATVALPYVSLKQAGLLD
jgi:hypothetical protein